MKYGERLKYARKLRGLTQEKLSEMSGVKQGSISKIEREEQDSSGFDAKLAYALSVPAIWLSSEVGEIANGVRVSAGTKGIVMDMSAPPSTASSKETPQPNDSTSVTDITNFTINEKAMTEALNRLEKDFSDWKDKENHIIAMLLKPYYEGVINAKNGNNK